ncbi:MAG: hypothetical protein AAFU57_05695 [Bacteroidota bacterium]
MKQVFRNILLFLLSTLMVASTISWTVDKHLCMGRVMDVALFSHADSCGTFEDTTSEAMSKMSCCDDESFTLQGQEDLTLKWFELDLDQQLFLFTYASAYIDSFKPLSEAHPFHVEYPPPNPAKDFQVLHQVFLI